MKRILVLLMAGLLISCSSSGPPPTEVAVDSPTAARSAPLAAATTGTEVAAELERRYRDTRDDCGAASKPAFLCSGIILRGTEASTSFDAWNPSPISVANGGVSFTYLRSDYKVKRLAYTYDSGFIFHPILSNPPGKLFVEILCFFPVDGDSNGRSDGGCGAHKEYPTTSRSCEEQSPVIDTAAKWQAKYIASGNARAKSMCSFNVRDSTNTASAPRFLEGMRAGRLISPDAFNTPNDMKLKTWAQNIPLQLPIEAFFYTKPTGLAGAQFYQQRFRALTGITVPIISIPLPQTLEQSATFTYRVADQTL
ncbi:halovibrin HvnA [Pseudomonas sp. SWRI92]|uniref:halovibrin HvnA n=1 Tax=Pseudomonas sp. SWRI92 TaxID=2745499 RepID=UPI001649567D|nr:halovibrin HvnA [Pseudomonas sp. SWRI92]MBC3375455.1 halovibrin HvnA [Pseudomonas sp. SWRI92]